MNAVNTNILLYSIDRAEPVKQQKAQQLLEQLRRDPVPTVMLWQVLGELGQQLRRWRDQGKLAPEEYKAHLHAFRHIFPVALPTAPVFDAALDLAGRFSLSHWDSILLGACIVAGIGVLYTEDMGAPRKLDAIVLINPFT